MDETAPKLLWDCGTAYDMFVSLAVLHDPEEFGVRGTWAAGMRARLPDDAREILAEIKLLIYVPLHWIHTLPDPKDGAAVLWSLGQIPSGERLTALTLSDCTPPNVIDILQDIAARQTWTEGDREALQAVLSCEGMHLPLCLKDMTTALNWWARTEEFGERYLEALRSYQEVFFAEEEKRIYPALERATSQAQKLAERLSLRDLMEELSQGIRFSQLPRAPEMVLVPSYWITPLILTMQVSDERHIWLFGARPPEASLIPGDIVPETMTRTLKALSDPTRLRILRYLSEEPLTPAQLARRLRLRAPTVTHHLKALRLAGLVQLTLDKEEGKRQERYAARAEAVATTFASLRGFLGSDTEGSTGDTTS